MNTNNLINMDNMNTKNKMNTNTLNLNKMKTRILKFGIAAICIFAMSTVNAQTDPTATDTAKEAGIVYGAGQTGGSVRVIDNKGTIKYLQSNNGITMISNTAANGDVTTTTWQLGGTIVDNTYIDVDDNIFAFNGLELEAGAASTDATTDSDAGTGTGWTVLVRDELTGETKKLLASSLVQSGHEIFNAAEDQTTYPLTITTEVLVTFSKVWVYRNGAKLLAGVDYTVATSDNNVELVPSPGGGVSDWSVYADDVIEVQYVK